MYEFRDVNEVSEGVLLPSEAMKINGKFIEEVIPEYRTLSVSGREAMSSEIELLDVGIRDGSNTLYKRYPARTIIVQYQIIAKTNEAFREAYNKLGRILNVQDAELIFNDEPDKFFKGTPVAVEEVEPGRNAVVGNIEIICADPFKYSVVEYEATTSEENPTTILIDYQGTHKAYPMLHADFFKESEVAEDGTTTALTGSGDCGFVAFFNEQEKIIQLGNPEEIDIDTSASASQTLMNQLFTGQYAWGETAQGLWAVNSATGLVGGMRQRGSVGSRIASTEELTEKVESTTGTLLKTISNGSPKVNYTVSAKAYDRTENSVKVDISIIGSLALDSNYLGNGIGLQASVFIGGSWQKVTLKKTTDYWKGRTGHTSNLTVTITGLTKDANILSGIKFKVARTDSGGTAGIISETKCSDLKIMTFAESVMWSYYLTATDYGTVSSSELNRWHGASITRTLSADKNGEYGASEFILTYKQRMCISKSVLGKSQLGAFQVQCLDDNGNSVVGVRISKNNVGQNANLTYFINGEIVFENTVNLGYNNLFYGASEAEVKSCNIRKTGNQVVFNMGVHRKVFTHDSYAGSKVYKVVFAFEKFGEHQALEHNGLYWAKFTKHNDLKNTFTANDELRVDCKNGEIFLNNASYPSLGALGNDWEEFYLVPGFNVIGVAYSSWLGDIYAPKCKVKYREVYL